MKKVESKQKNSLPFNRQLYQMVKHAQTIRRLVSTNCLSVFDHFVGLALKRLNEYSWSKQNIMRLIIVSNRSNRFSALLKMDYVAGLSLALWKIFEKFFFKVPLRVTASATM